MGSKAAWRGSTATWRARVTDWIARSRPDDLVSVDIFFDMVGVYGEPALASELWRSAFDIAAGKASFAKLLAAAAGEVKPGLTLWGHFRTENGRIDLKRTGLFSIVSAARVLAIRHHLLERSTRSRLSAMVALGHGGKHDLDALARAQSLFLELILNQQLADLRAGLPPSNKVAVKRLTYDQRTRLHEAFNAVRHLEALIQDLLF